MYCPPDLVSASFADFWTFSFEALPKKNAAFLFLHLMNNEHFPLQDGDRFWRMPECYIRGSTIKYLRIPDEVIDMVKEENLQKSKGRGDGKGRGGNRGGRGGPGRGESNRGIISDIYGCTP